MNKKAYTMLFRQHFVEKWLRSDGGWTFIEHCERFGVPRPTAYEWLARYRALGVCGLEDKSSAPHFSPHATKADVVDLVVRARRDHPTWGPRKLKAWIEETLPWDVELPAASTIGDILKRAGLVTTKNRRQRAHRYATPYSEATAPNDVWTTDFKGHFRLLDGHYCYPLTLVDNFSRFLLRCDAYRSTSFECRRSFESAFVEYGLPAVIRSDNGSPFASANTLGGLSKLSVWWIRLGILPERIKPGSPWENGSHERMHRTLKQEATDPPQRNRTRQQKSFDVFRAEFNEERPHEALGMKPPTKFYAASRRSYPSKLVELEYPSAHLLRRVSDIGVISWEGHRVFLSSVLAGQVVALQQMSESSWHLHFGPILLGALDAQNPQLGVQVVSDNEEDA
jgi:transposase InsO family protein